MDVAILETTDDFSLKNPYGPRAKVQEWEKLMGQFQQCCLGKPDDHGNEADG
jgi:hypothetical protein